MQLFNDEAVNQSEPPQQTMTSAPRSPVNSTAHPTDLGSNQRSLTTEGSSIDSGVTSGLHSSGVKAELLRTSAANRKWKRQLSHRFIVLMVADMSPSLSHSVFIRAAGETNLQVYTVWTQRFSCAQFRCFWAFCDFTTSVFVYRSRSGLFKQPSRTFRLVLGITLNTA